MSERKPDGKMVRLWASCRTVVIKPNIKRETPKLFVIYNPSRGPQRLLPKFIMTLVTSRVLRLLSKAKNCRVLSRSPIKPQLFPASYIIHFIKYLTYLFFSSLFCRRQLFMD